MTNTPNHGIKFEFKNGINCIETINLPKDIDFNYCYKELDISLIELLHLPNDIVVILDEEGLLKNNHVNTFLIANKPIHLAGNILILASNPLTTKFEPLSEHQLIWLENNLKYYQYPTHRTNI